MKAPEFYVQELITVLHCIQTTTNLICQSFERDRRKTEREMFFRPWAKSSIGNAFAIRSQVVLEILKDLRELQEKLLDSTGVDEDMRPVSLKKMLKIED
jgi:hypothetical protein